MRNVLHFVVGLSVCISLSSGCNSGCPVGTTNQGNTCKPVHDQAGQGEIGTGTNPSSGAMAGAGGGGGSASTAAKGGDSAGRASGNTNTNNTNTGMAGMGAVAGRGTGSAPPSGPASGSGGQGYDVDAAGDGAAGEEASSSNSSSGSSGHSAGAGGDAQEPQGEPCSTEGAVRCAESGMGARESCRSGIWAEDSPCPDGNTCATSASGAPACQPLSSVCMASAQPVTCDSQGVMLMCNENGTATMLAACRNAKLCEAGLAAGRCATCLPGTAICNGKNLERCSTDGSAFQLEQDCKSAPLCDQSGGKCKAPVCEAGSYTCNGDSLDQCKPDLTGYNNRRCGAGLCDARNKTCMTCKPGTVTCSQSTLVTCDAAGQRMERSSTCSGESPICDAAVGACVQCRAPSDCSTDNACATAGGCSLGKCTYKPKYSAPSASGNGSTIRSGVMDPDPVYVSYGRALFWVPNEGELNAYYGGFGPVTVVNGSITGYNRCPVAGTLIRERGDPHVYVSTGSALVWVKDPTYLAQCSWTINDVPTQSLHNTMYVPPAGNCPLRED